MANRLEPVQKIKPQDWATFHIRIRLDEAYAEQTSEGTFGHNDRLVLEYYEKPQDKHPIERLYFDFDYHYDSTYDATDAIEELLDTLEWDLAMAEAGK